MKKRVIAFLAVIASCFFIGGVLWVQAEDNIVASGSGSMCGDWTLYTDGTLYIEGSSIGDFSSSNPPWYSYKEQITSLIVSDNMRSIGIDAFYEMPNLKSVMVEGVTSFGKNSFGYCEALEEVHFVPSNYGSGSVSIGNSAFAGCKSLKEISLPSSTSIGEYAFSGCSALKKIYLLPTTATIPSFGAKTNSFNDVVATVYYPKNVKFYASVQSGEYGGTFTWKESLTGVYGTGCEWEYNESTSTLTITGTGEMASTMSGSQTPWYYLVDEIKHIIMNGDITYIPSYVFEYQTNVETIQLPKTLEALACNAFNDCEKLNNLLIPYSVNRFTMQFNRCGSMTDLYYEGTEEEWTAITGVNNAYGTSSGTKFNIHYLEYNEKVDSTCTQEGREAYYSFGEDSIYTQIYDDDRQIIDSPKVIAAKEHNYGAWITDKAATCTEEGNEYRKCENCDSVKTRTTEPLGHEFIEYIFDNNATCTEDGTITAKCERCDVTDTVTEEGTATGHEFEACAGTDPTCTEAGFIEYACIRCWDESVTHREELKALGHEFVEYVSDNNATCTEDGTKTAKCERCEETDTITEENTATGHEFEACMGTDPTCTEAGFIEYACIRCWDESVTYREELKALGHVEVTDEAIEATCEKTGKTEGSHCDRCKEILVAQKEVEALGHEFVEYVSDNNATCTEDGTKTAKCTRCEETNTITEEETATGHEFEACMGTDPTCTEAGFIEYACIRCWDESVTYREELKALGHVEVTDEAIEATCEKTGKTEGSHCDRCKEILVAQESIKATGHSYRTSIIVATTKLDGAVQVRCIKCNDVESEEIIPAIGKVILSKTKLVYNAKTQKVDVVVTDIDGNAISSEYYTATNTSKKNVGVYTVTVTFKGNYEGTVKLKYSIVPKAPASLKAELYQYGNKVKLTWEKATGATGYRISFKKPGSSSYTYLTSTTELTYTKSGLLQNKKYTFKVTPYYKPSGSSTQYYSTASTAYKTKAITTTTKGKQLVKVAQPTVAKSGTKVKVTWKNVANETGYQISKSTSSTGTNIVSTYKTTTGKSKTIAATKGTKYYYKVRAYRVANGRYIYGDWSAVRAYTRK